MKSETEIIAQMQKDPNWRLPDPKDLGIDGNKILEREAKKFMAEVKRRLKIQQTSGLNVTNKETNQLYFAIKCLEEERTKLMKHYEENIHGDENWKSYEKAESIRYAQDILQRTSDRLYRKGKDLQKIVNERTEKNLEVRCPKCGGPCYDQGPDGSEESYECQVCQYYFLQGEAMHWNEEDF